MDVDAAEMEADAALASRSLYLRKETDLPKKESASIARNPGIWHADVPPNLNKDSLLDLNQDSSLSIA